MSDLDTIFDSWSKEISHEVGMPTSFPNRMVMWATSTRRLLGLNATFDWTRTTYTINGAIILTAPGGVIPSVLHQDFHRYTPGYGHILNINQLATTVIA